MPEQAAKSPGAAAIAATQPTRPLRVAAFTGGAAVPAARFRVRQYVEPLSQLGVELQERWPSLGAYPPSRRALRPAWLVGTLVERLPQVAASWRADITLLQREMVSTVPTLEGLTRRPRLVDIDDAIHLYRGGLAARHLAALADLVVVGNAWLAEVWRNWSPSVEILPTAVDTEVYVPAAVPQHPVIGWIGSAGNLPYLSDIAPALACVVSRYPGTMIAVCSDSPPQLGDLPVRYVPWSVDVEPDFLASITIGVMPLQDHLWERGKCSFKMLQYMAAGRPCVVSPIGMNSEILHQAELGLAANTLSEWTEALSALLDDPVAAGRMGQVGRALAEARYSVNALAPRLAELLHRLT